ncbi:hypothetical protein BDW22DRAFT_259794 [Trametopsis cervina]|nr:hypothetical protein BDW22DRAFT_259794 [Trametopsis cervina]
MLSHLATFSRRKPDSNPPRWSSLLAGAGIPGTSNLRLYLAQAQLPLMLLGRDAPRVPEEGHKTHRNTLSVRAENWRKLSDMSIIPSTVFDDYTSRFIHMHIPSHDLRVADPDDDSGDRLTVPCSVFRIADTIIGRPSDVLRVSQWITQFPLATLQRVLHLVFPHTQEWSFSPVMADADDDIVSCVTWDRRNPDRSVDSAVAVMMQPPWIVSAADLDSFVNCTRLSHPKENITDEEMENGYQSKERMWAKVWDFCARRGCNYFVVTTYWGWAFGNFSRGKTRGFITSVRPHDTISPTILEALTFWFGSAMDISGGWMIPEVAEPVFDVNLGVPDLMLPPETYVRFDSPAPSESIWHADSQANDDSMSIAERQEVLQIVTSPTGVEDAPIPPPTFQNAFHDLTENVLNWQLTGTSYHVHGLPPSAFQVPSEISSAITVSSAASTCNEERHTNGDWLSQRPSDLVNYPQLVV